MLKETISKFLFVLNPNPTRGMMKYVKANLKGELVGAEIGIAEGFHVYKYLKTIPNIKEVYLVDPYQSYTMNGEIKNYASSEEDAKKRLRPFRTKTRFIKMTSVDASHLVFEEFDFVYIDANHDYEHTLQDITLWYPKVKKGGVIGGHDFSAHFPGVAKAVIEYAEKHNLKICGEGSDWWFVL
jgi:hypothetical protein